MSHLPTPIDLIAVITESPFRDSDMYGYQLGSTATGAWQTLIICTPFTSDFRAAADTAEVALNQARSALHRKFLRNRQRSKAVIDKLWDDGPGVA